MDLLSYTYCYEAAQLQQVYLLVVVLHIIYLCCYRVKVANSVAVRRLKVRSHVLFVKGLSEKK
jgi:hypothetical protein